MPEALTVRNADTAYVTVVVPPGRRAITSGSYIVVYTTSNGGRTWRSSIVLPPSR